MTPVDPLAVTGAVAKILDEIGIRYVIGGSVAASVYGKPRTTLDVDLMIEADENQIRQLVAKLLSDFYVDEETAVEAVRSTSSFNAIHYATSLKLDLFLAERDPFATRQLERRRLLEVAPGLTLYFYAPEDVIIRKLMWYRAGGGVSERQWSDVLGILKLSSGLIDWNELRRAARHAGVEDLLSGAMKEAKIQET